ncbi:hypothetical protein AB0J83_22015 [Actinoplanes sp. NPDC049596]|uniref:hypothetical protein n=1 Tax=unclassified Actinoplanes TaxID=2626549 RepID=UPI0034325E13
MRRVLIGVGVLVMAYGLTGVAFDRDRLGVVVFLIAVLVLHDGVFMPLVLAGGALIGRVVPAGWQAPARTAGLVGLAVAVVGVPLVAGPLDGAYGWGLVSILVLVTAVVVGRKGIERWRKGRGAAKRG